MFPKALPHITSPYATGSASEPTRLWAGRLHLVAGGRRSTGDGLLELAWRPEPWIAWRQQPSRLIPAVLNADAGLLIPYGLSTKAAYQRTNLTVRSAGSAEAVGYVPDGLEIGGGELHSMLFHLVNFPDYIGAPVESGSSSWLGRLSFQARGWTVDVDWVEGYSALKKGLRADHGYAMTHNARLTRSDGRRFHRGQALRFVESLHRLFGFVRGRWAGPALLVGQDTTNAAVWEHWSTLRVSPAVDRHSIFIAEDPESIARLAPGFLGRLESEAWGTAFARAISFYVDGNFAVPIEVGIVLAQAGLELLAWSKLVRSGRVSPSDYEDLSAGDQFRRLLQPAGVSMHVPTELPNLAGPLPGLRASADAADRIAYVRNKIVHPPSNRKLAALPGPLIVDTWRLSLHMLEIAILQLAGYHGRIWSRVKEKAVPVPWS